MMSEAVYSPISYSTQDSSNYAGWQSSVFSASGTRNGVRLCLCGELSGHWPWLFISVGISRMECMVSENMWNNFQFPVSVNRYTYSMLKRQRWNLVVCSQKGDMKGKGEEKSPPPKKKKKQKRKKKKKPRSHFNKMNSTAHSQVLLFLNCFVSLAQLEKRRLATNWGLSSFWIFFWLFCGFYWMMWHWPSLITNTSSGKNAASEPSPAASYLRDCRQITSFPRVSVCSLEKCSQLVPASHS